uniref:Putative acyl-coa:dihydroxyactetone-phosphate acyltransferase dhapat n=1 Tax=Ixodes ricinus TaxID=34613 RepID=A0A0K8RA51_IXORI
MRMLCPISSRTFLASSATSARGRCWAWLTSVMAAWTRALSSTFCLISSGVRAAWKRYRGQLHCRVHHDRSPLVRRSDKMSSKCSPLRLTLMMISRWLRARVRGLLSPMEKPHEMMFLQVVRARRAPWRKVLLTEAQSLWINAFF